MEHNTQTVAANAAATLANDIEATASTTTMPASNTKSRSINSDIDKSPTSCCSNNSLTSSSSSTTSSAPQYSEDIRRHMPPGNLDLLPRQGSGSSNKTCEVDLGEEERDSFSPVTNTNSSNSHSPLELGAGSFPINVLNLDPSTSNKLQYDNKIIEGSQQILSESKPKPNTQVADVASSGNLSTTKEQKQRQNEEIVIMETSSVSSETGSWESVFPQAGPVPVTCANVMLPSSDLRSDLKQFVTMEKPLEQHKLEEETRGSDFLGAQKEGLHMSPYFNTEATANTSSLLNNVTVGMSMTSLLRDLDKRDNALNTSGTSACFIDASSLRDEDEVLSFPSLETHQQLPPDDCVKNQEEHFTPAAVASKEEPVNSTDCVEEEDDDDSPTKKLETFHMVFAKCKTKSKDVLDSSPLAETNSVSSSSSHSAADSPQKQSPSSVNNLSDEEKLWKRNQENPTTKLATEKDKHSTHEDITEASVSLAVDLDSSDSSDIVKLRREQRERKISAPMQVMPQQLQQFTIHPLGASPKFNQHHPQLHQHTAIGSQVSHQSHHSDVSYTTDYSSSSPAPSLAWSEHEHRSTHIPTRSQANDSLTNHSMLPDTPHNSIVHIENGSSNASSHRDYTLSSSFSHQRDSGAYCSDATDSPIPLPRTPKRSKYDETNPIISGGVSIKDIYVKKCESPTPQRRTENCPIVSGGFVSLDFEPTRPLDEPEDGEEAVEMRKKSLARKPISNLASWVVDMSDCRPERRKSTSSNSSLEASKFRERSDSNSSHKSGCGFFVSLNDMDKKPEAPKPQENQMSKSYTAPKSAGFFVNLTQSDYQPKVGESPSKAENVKDEMSDSMEKKNIFSMFIDIGDDKKSGGIQKKEPYHLAQRLSSSINNSQKRNDDIMKSSASSTETLMSKSSNFKNTIVAVESNGENTESKSLDYKCNIEPPITVAAIRRLSQQHRNQNEASKRHSWGNSQVKDTTSDCKRSTSFTVNPSDAKESAGNGLMSIIDKLPLLSKASSLSVDSSVSPYDEYMGSKSEISSTCSNNSNRNSASEREDEAVPAIPGARFKKRRKDAQINETYDKSSVGSLTDGVISKDLSPASNTDTDDITFQQDEEMAAAAVASNLNTMNSSSGGNSNRTSAIIMETIIEAKETSSPKKTAGAGHTMESLHATIEKQQKMLLETVNENTEVGKSAFVKLSDMDKPIRLEDKSPERMMSKSAGGNTHRHMSKLYRDGNDGNNKTRPYSWGMTRSTGNNSFHNITNSADNLRSLSRLFPNFSKEFSSSMPSDITMEQADYIQTDLSNDSSLASSFSRSGMDESSISCRQPRRLGEDLLKMFLQEIATDMIVEVHGRKLKAHKCILRSRCQYFAAMLAGSNASSVVSLQGYSYSAVHFALCHIYSGASHPPDGISLMELAALADLLGLEGLKEVTAHALRINYCHNFHKPCTGCIDGILQVLPVALNHALDDLYRKCLRWTCRHYLKVWPTRQFSQLPPDILGRCRQQIVAYLTSETVLDTVLDCDHLLAQLATYRWGGVCENLVRDIMDAAYGYISDHFASLIASDAFLSLGHDRSCHIPRLEGLILQTAASLTPDQACRSYQRVTRLNTVLQAKMIQMPANLGALAKELQGLQEEELDWDTEYIRLVSAILSAVEQCLIRQCSKAMRTTAWQRMDLELRKKIQTLARLTEPLDLKRGKPVSKAFSFGGSTRNQDLHQVKLAIQAHTRKALAQDTQLYKATQTQHYEQGNIQTTERAVQANHDLREGTSRVLKSNSRAHVPQAHHRASSQSAAISERNSYNMQRRTQSEAPATNKTVESKESPQKAQKPRLAEVRPRYLEPRKARATTVQSNAGPIRSATTASIPTVTKAKARQLSSSESSRTSSPAARKNVAANNNRVGTRSTNMSMDNLTGSSLRRGKSSSRGRSSDNERYSDLGGIDSRADSMKSSVITNKTVSQESLHLYNRPTLASANKQQAKQLEAAKSSSQQKLNKAASNLKVNKHLQAPTSNGSSPSSVNTNKSATSRLSSVSSQHSARDLYNKNRSISVPAAAAANSDEKQQRKSFISAKSREILAKRAEKNKQLQQKSQTNLVQNSSGDEKSSNQSHSNKSTAGIGGGIMRSASHSVVPTASSSTFSNQNTRNSLPPSNIPTRRPNTLNLRKTNGYNRINANKSNSSSNTNLAANTNTNSNANTQNGKQKTTNITTNGVMKAAQAVKQKLELLIDATHQTAEPIKRIESKLERSSTFCKESSDLDLNELQIIE